MYVQMLCSLFCIFLSSGPVCWYSIETILLIQYFILYLPQSVLRLSKQKACSTVQPVSVCECVWCFQIEAQSKAASNTSRQTQQTPERISLSSARKLFSILMLKHFTLRSFSNRVDFLNVLRLLVIVTIKVFSQPSCADGTVRAINGIWDQKKAASKKKEEKKGCYSHSNLYFKRKHLAREYFSVLTAPLFNFPLHCFICR